MKKYKIGYTQGVYDMFHVGHLNLLNNAKKYCDYLVVGINSDELVQDYKNKIPVIKESERRLIVANIKAVDQSIIVNTLNKIEVLKDIDYDAIFIGDDWKNDSRWQDTKKELSLYNKDVVFLPYTPEISSTKLREVTKVRVNEIS